MAKTFSQKMSDARLMSAGIRAHTEELTSVSLGEEQAAQIDSYVETLRTLDTQQEKLKAELKTCTAELDKNVSALNDVMQDAKKRVKLTIPQAGWHEFGISDKR